MALIRAINLRYWDKRLDRFQSLVFSGYKNGLSVFDSECAIERSENYCSHLRRFYGSVAGSPPCYWVIPDGAIPDHCGFKWTLSDKGDDCHGEITGLTKADIAALTKRLDPTGCTVCLEIEGARPLTRADLLHTL